MMERLSLASRLGGWLSPVVHLSNNPLSLIGVTLVTSATVLWLFLLPTSLGGDVANPYVGILAFLMLPGVFLLGLCVIPAGIYLRFRAERKKGSYPTNFPPLNFRNIEFRRLTIFVFVATLVNFVIAGQTGYRGDVHGGRRVLRQDMSHRDGTRIRGLPEFAPLAGGMCQLSYRIGSLLVCAQQTFWRRAGLRGHLQHLPPADSHPRP